MLWIGARDGSHASLFYSADGTIAAEIVRDKFYINRNNVFRHARPDRHTLVVYDLQGDEALYIRYVNPTTVKLRGHFAYPGYMPVIIDDASTLIGDRFYENTCMGGAAPGGAIISIE